MFNGSSYTKCVNPDQMQHSAAFDLGLHLFLCTYIALTSDNLTQRFAHPSVRRVVTDSVRYIAIYSYVM